MNQNITHLYKIGQKPKRKIIGLMAGTSLDGLDIALCDFAGSGANITFSIEKFCTQPFSNEYKQYIKKIFSRKDADLELVTLLNERIGEYFAELVNITLQEWSITPDEIDLIASHGQSVFHSPQKNRENYDDLGNGTLQIGDGDHIAVGTGIITLSDFRQKNIAAGGEGAPLAAYGDYLLFSSATENRVLLNIGGISNLSFIPAGEPEKFISTDLGPGNTLMDQFVHSRFPELFYDKDGLLAGSGKVNYKFLEELFNTPFFSLAYPKTTGPEVFNLTYIDQALNRAKAEQLSTEDIMASLTAFTAKSIIRGVDYVIKEFEDFYIYVSGGGGKNPVVFNQLKERYGNRVCHSSEIGIDPDAKEALIFAFLANETVAGGDYQKFAKNRNMKGFPIINGFPFITMGKISLPN